MSMLLGLTVVAAVVVGADAAPDAGAAAVAGAAGVGWAAFGCTVPIAAGAGTDVPQLASNATVAVLSALTRNARRLSCILRPPLWLSLWRC
jgi:hypothetical protein